jgi:hypothetical protein
MWGATFVDCSEILKKFGMLEEGYSRSQLTPFMMNYAAKTIPHEFKDRFNIKIAEFYEEMLRKFYNSDKNNKSLTI